MVFLIVDLVDGNGVDNLFAYMFELDWSVYVCRANWRRALELDCGKVTILLTSNTDPAKARGGTSGNKWYSCVSVSLNSRDGDLDWVEGLVGICEAIGIRISTFCIETYVKGDSHCGCACGGNDARSLVFDNTSTFLSLVSLPHHLSATAQDLLKEHLPLLTLTLVCVQYLLIVSLHTTSQPQTTRICKCNHHSKTMTFLAGRFSFHIQSLTARIKSCVNFVNPCYLLLTPVA
ncbi:hypothetical protein KCU83_g127, partial [Aureobasidium melanogenum]